MKTVVPFDILAHITDIVDAQSDKGTLRALSLTCKFMVPLCRRHLFSSIKLFNTTNNKEQGLIYFLSGSPDTTCRIKHLLFIIRTKLPTCKQIIDILEVMRSQSTSLQSVTISSSGWLEWNILPEPIKSLLISLIQLPTVTRLKLGIMRNFPLAPLSLCSGLNDITISEVSEATPQTDQIIARSNIPAPTSLYARRFHSAISVLMRPPDLNINGAIIDFSRLEKAVFEISEQSEALQLTELLKTVTQLQKLSIDCT